MYRASATVCWRSLSDSFWRSVSPPQHVPRVAAMEFVFCRTISTAPEETTAKSMQMQIVDALRFGEKSKAFELLSSLGNGNYSLKANDFIDILSYCARSPDPLFVIETWRVMEENQISPDHISSLLMMRALCNGGYLDEAFRFMNLLGETQGIFPLLSIYNTFLGACARKHSIGHANQCLDLMDSRMMGVNEITFSELLKLAVLQKDLSGIQEICNEYIKKYSPNIIFLRYFIWSQTQLGELKSAYEALQQMVVLAMRDSTSIFKIEGGKFSKKFDIPIPLKHEVGLKQFASSKSDNDASNEDQDIVLTINDRLPQHVLIRRVNGDTEHKTVLNVYNNELVMKVLRWSFDDVIHACARLNDYGLAKQLLAQMQKLGVQPSSHTYDGFIKAVVRERDFSSGIEVLKIMQHRGVKALENTLATLSISCSQALELDLAEALLHQISDYKYAHPFNVFFSACDTLDKPECAVRALAKMRKLKILPDIRTYELLFSLFGTVNSPYERGNKLSSVMVLKRIQAIEMDMEENGIQHSHISMNNLLKALGAERMIEIMIQYLQKAESLFGRTQTDRTPIYNTVLHSLVMAKKIRTTVKIFKIMQSGGVPPDAATYSIMVNCCTLKRSFRSAFALVSLMYRDGFFPHGSAISALLKILFETKKFYEALDLLDQASAQGIEFNVLLFNTILQKASKKGMIDVIEFIVERMHQEKIKPDTSTCYHVFSAYVRCGLHSTAMEALQVLSLRMLCEEYGSLSEEDLEIIRDELVLTEDDGEAEKRTLQLFENYEENMAVALLNLRWSAMLNFPISWSPDQTAWAKRLAAAHYGRDVREKSQPAGVA